MPQFMLDTGDQESTRRFETLDSFTQGYIEALFFTDQEQLCEESGRDMPAVAVNRDTMETRFIGGDSPGFGDLAAKTLEKIIADCKSFQERNAAFIEAASELEPGSEGLRYAREALDDRRLGQLFWYARNGHGVAFTDDGDSVILKALQVRAQGFRQVDSGMGDDGKIYLD